MSNALTAHFTWGYQDGYHRSLTISVRFVWCSRIYETILFITLAGSS